MKKSAQWKVFIRRTYIFYVFLAVLAAVLLIYFYYHIPSNQKEFNERGSRVLNRLVANFLTRSGAMENAFSESSIDFSLLQARTGAYENLYKNTRYEVSNAFTSQTNVSIEKANDWMIVFLLKHRKKTVRIRIEDFAQPLFASRNDVFDGYLLLRPDTTEKDGSGRLRRGFWNIVYDHKNSTVSERLTIDTLAGLQQNSDMAGIIDLGIGGRPMKVFFQPFEVSGQKMALAGLIPRAKYQQYVRSTPVNFVVAAITLIVLILIILPFLKVFLLSRNENISSTDVLASTLSIFLGTVTILLILCYVYMYALSQGAFQSRIYHIGRDLKKDIETQITKAVVQLDRYGVLYDSLSDIQKKVLYYDPDAENFKEQVDSAFVPLEFPSLTRVLWIDSAGNTLAKWNPFSYEVPLSNVSSYAFFKRLSNPHKYNRQSDDIIVYSGKSNTTDEFQVYVVKPDRRPILTRYPKKGYPETVNASAILLATPLHCSQSPVLPPGFGFCLIDENGEVLVHSDSLRNLSENLLSETRHNKKLLNSLQFKNSGIIRNVTLYGVPQDMIVLPLQTGNLSLAVFFNKRKVTDNISRLIHFTVSCLLYIFVALTICIAFSTHPSGDPSKLKFNLNKIEWIRPSNANTHAYLFTNTYFKNLLLFNGLLFVLILLADLDIRNILFLSFQIPFYSLWAFIAVRNQVSVFPRSERQNTWWIRQCNNLLKNIYSLLLVVLHRCREIFAKHKEVLTLQKSRLLIDEYFHFINRTFTASRIVIVLIVLLNAIFIYWLAVHHTAYGLTDSILYFGAQLVYLFLFAGSYLPYAKPLRYTLQKPDSSFKDESKQITRNYLQSLYWSLLLISVLPTVGIVSYAYYAEKIQYKKHKQLSIAAQFDRRSKVFGDSSQNMYKSSVNEQLQDVLDSQVVRNGIYLSDNDSVSYGHSKMEPQKISLKDEPYSLLIDKLYQITLPAFGEFTIKNVADNRDTAWQFYTHGNSLPWIRDTLVCQYRLAGNGSMATTVHSSYQNPLYNFLSVLFPGGFLFVFIIGSFLYLGRKLINATMKRLFVLNFFKDYEVDSSNLVRFFEHTNKDSRFLGKIKVDSPMKLSFFEGAEESQKPGDYDQEETILRLTHCFAPVYDKIWDAQSDEEKYLLFDLSRDGYTNYKNADLIFILIQKGILKYENYKLRFFSLSFRNYVLGKKDTPVIQQIITRFAAGGVWQSIKMPLLMIMVSVIAFFVLTQNDIASDITALLTPLAALIPVLFQLISRSSAKKE